MPSVFDIHAIVALQERWAEIRGDLALFKLHFTDEAIPEALLNEWHASLAADGIEIRGGWTLSPPSTPLVGVTFDDEPSDEQVLGSFARYDGADEVLSMITRQTVTIRSWAPNMEISRGLRVLLRNMMMVSTRWFADLGYGEVYYLGGGDLRPEEAMSAEQLGTWIQSQRWAAIGESSATIPNAVTHKPPFVAAEDTVVDGFPGGVSPWET